MAWTDAEQARVEALEEALILLQTAVSNLVAKQQVRQLSLLKQAEIDVLEAKVASLEAQMAEIEGRV